MQIISLSGYFGILLLLVDSLMKGEIGVGAFAAVFASVDQMFHMVKGLVDRISTLSGNFGRVQNYISFLQMPEREGVDIEIPVDVDIKLANVSFSYPGAERKLLTM